MLMIGYYILRSIVKINQDVFFQKCFYNLKFLLFLYRKTYLNLGVFIISFVKYFPQFYNQKSRNII